PEGEILRKTPSLWTAYPDFGRYREVMHAGFGRALRNSLVVATGTTVAGVAVAALAGYALARFDLPLGRYMRLLVMGVEVVRLVRQELAARTIFSVTAAWNEFLVALTFLKKESLRTLPVALTAFVGRSQADWGLIMAASVLFTIPVVVFFLAVHRRLTTGMVAGSVTG